MLVHFTIRIRKKDVASSGKAMTRSGTSENCSGEVTVYLPWRWNHSDVRINIVNNCIIISIIAMNFYKFVIIS